MFASHCPPFSPPEKRIVFGELFNILYIFLIKITLNPTAVILLHRFLLLLFLLMGPRCLIAALPFYSYLSFRRKPRILPGHGRFLSFTRSAAISFSANLNRCPAFEYVEIEARVEISINHRAIFQQHLAPFGRNNVPTKLIILQYITLTMTDSWCNM